MLRNQGYKGTFHKHFTPINFGGMLKSVEIQFSRYVHDFRSKVLERLYSTDYDETGEEEDECDWEWEEVSEDGEGAGVELIMYFSSC